MFGRRFEADRFPGKSARLLRFAGCLAVLAACISCSTQTSTAPVESPAIEQEDLQPVETTEPKEEDQQPVEATAIRIITAIFFIMVVSKMNC